MALTAAELQALKLLRQKADAEPSRAALRAQYYDFIASYGGPYAALASQVPQGLTLNGAVANWFFIDQDCGSGHRGQPWRDAAASEPGHYQFPSVRLSQATSLGSVVQQLTMGLGVSLSAGMLGLLASADGRPTVAEFQTVFLLIALLPLLAVPGFWALRPADGAEVSGRR